MSDLCLGSLDSLFYLPGSLCLKTQRLKTPKPKKHIPEIPTEHQQVWNQSQTQMSVSVSELIPYPPECACFIICERKEKSSHVPLKVQVSLRSLLLNRDLFTASPGTVGLYLGIFCSGCRDNAMHTTLADHCDLLLFEEIRFPEGIKHKKLERSDNAKCWGMTCRLIFF